MDEPTEVDEAIEPTAQTPTIDDYTPDTIDFSELTALCHSTVLQAYGYNERWLFDGHRHPEYSELLLRNVEWHLKSLFAEIQRHVQMEQSAKTVSNFMHKMLMMAGADVKTLLDAIPPVGVLPQDAIYSLSCVSESLKVRLEQKRKEAAARDAEWLDGVTTKSPSPPEMSSLTRRPKGRGGKRPTNELTAEQASIVKLYGDHDGSPTKVAKVTGKTVQYVSRTYKTAMAKLGRVIAKKHKTVALKSDLRGQVNIVESDDRRRPSA